VEKRKLTPSAVKITRRYTAQRAHKKLCIKPEHWSSATRGPRETSCHWNYFTKKLSCLRGWGL